VQDRLPDPVWSIACPLNINQNLIPMLKRLFENSACVVFSGPKYFGTAMDLLKTSSRAISPDGQIWSSSLLAVGLVTRSRLSAFPNCPVTPPLTTAR
jgi:hypothetical protein